MRGAIQALQETVGPDEFFDALASIRSSVSSFVTTTAASLRASDAGDSSFASARSGASGGPPAGSARSGSLASAPSAARPGSGHPSEAHRCASCVLVLSFGRICTEDYPAGSHVNPQRSGAQILNGGSNIISL